MVNSQIFTTFAFSFAINHMKYDVFISYSRKDMAIADRVCDALDSVGITYFVDRGEICAGEDFPEIISEAIINSSKVLFLASKSAYASKFVKREIFFAFKKKDEGDIIPYIIDNTKLPANFDFVFCTTNYRNIVDHPIETTLVVDMLQLLGRTSVGVSGGRSAKPQMFDSGITWAVFATCMFCNILGVVSIIFAVLARRAFMRDDYPTAKTYATTARVVAIVAIASTILLAIILISSER